MMNEVQKSLVELLKVFQDICKKCNLRYYASGGTLLGAIRHHGFIPWDDDIDLFMPRDDYDRLCDGSVNFDDRYKLIELDAIGHFVDTQTFISHGNEYWDKRYPNLSIDIFPLDGSPNNSIFRFIHISHCLVNFMLYKFMNIEFAINTESLKNRKNRSGIEKWMIQHGKMLNKLVGWINEEKFNKKFLKLQKKYKYEDSDYVGVYCGRHRYKEFFNRADVGKGRIVPFENGEMCILEKPENWLTTVYGPDYMKMPERGDRESHGDLKVVSKQETVN